MAEAQVQKIVVMSTKSVGVSILLTFFFGPLGMLYSTILGGIVMFVVSVIVAALTFGVGLFLTWPVCILSGALAANAHNKRLGAV